MIDSYPSSLTDIHSHLVPGVDDGARDLDESLQAVVRMAGQGIRKIITTPHINASLTHDPGALDARLGEVDEAFGTIAESIGQNLPDVEFKRGHEVMLDVPDPDLRDLRLHMAGTSFVLVEWPRLHLPPGTTQVLQRILGHGARPIIAHAERYHDLDLQTADEWRRAGAFLQVNYGSLAGRYGAAARTMAYRLLRRGWVDYMASDFHSRPDQRICMREARSRMTALGAEEAFVFLALTNPARVLRDETPLAVPAMPMERGFWAKMKDMLNLESV